MIFAIVLSAVGCATVSAVAPTDTPKTVTPSNGVNESAPVSVAGVWKGGNYHTMVHSIIIKLNQSGNVVDGTIDVDEHSSGMHSDNVHGSLEGNRLSLKIPNFTNGYITATVVGDRLEDGYYFGKANRVVKFSATRVSN